MVAGFPGSAKFISCAGNQNTMSDQAPDDTTGSFAGFRSPNYTQVPDELFDELLPVLSGGELKVLLYIIRRTFGFKRDSDTISINQMLNGITTRDGRVLDRGVGLTKKTLLAAIRSLEERNVILTERRRSLERGDEATSYQLNIADTPRGGKITPPVGEKLHQGGGGEITPGPWGKNSPTQYTEEQETEEQETDFETSKLRSVSALENEGSLGRRDRVGTPKGFSTPGDVLRSRGQRVRTLESPPRSAASAAEAQGQLTVREAPDGNPRENRPETASDDWQRIQFHIDEFRRELGDKATLRASTTRAYNLYTRSGVSIGVFVERLFQARTITQEHTASITSQGEDAAFKVKRKTKAAYFFSVLEDLLNLLPPEERARRDRLRAQAAERVEAAKRGERQAPKRKREDGEQGKNSQRSVPSRDSEGPYAPYIEH